MKRTTWHAIGIAIPMLAVSHCGSSNVGSCDYRNASKAAPTQFCQEDYAERSVLMAQKTACVANGGKWSDDPCQHEGALGGCHETSGAPTITFVNWYYSGGDFSSADSVMKSCAVTGATFVAP